MFSAYQDAPAAPFTSCICLEVDINNIGPTFNVGRHGIVALFVHQDSSVTVRDSQVVKITEGRRFQIEGGEPQYQQLYFNPSHQYLITRLFLGPLAFRICITPLWANLILR